MLLTAPGVLIWKTPLSTIRAQLCLTMVIEWVPEYQTWQDAILIWPRHLAMALPGKRDKTIGHEHHMWS
jgi:hypothetical protein